MPETLSRIINVFPANERSQITATLLSSLRLIVTQRLVPRKDGLGRVALREFLVFTPEIREKLLKLEPEFLIPTIEKLLLTDGQSIQTAARRAYRKKLISREKFLAIRSERSSMGDLFEE